MRATSILEAFKETCEPWLWALLSSCQAMIKSVVMRSAVQACDESILADNLKQLSCTKTREETDFAFHRRICCRLTAMLMLRVRSTRSIWSEAAEGTSFVEDIYFSLSRRGWQSLWNMHASLLLWVTLVAQAVFRGTRYRLFAVTISHQFLTQTSFEIEDARIGAWSPKRMADFEFACISGKIPEDVSGCGLPEWF
jgi:hypothetical protein